MKLKELSELMRRLKASCQPHDPEVNFCTGPNPSDNLTLLAIYRAQVDGQIYFDFSQGTENLITPVAKKRLYEVGIPQVHYSIRTVEATSEDEAKKLAAGVDVDDLCYDRTLEEGWKVREVK